MSTQLFYDTIPIFYNPTDLPYLNMPEYYNYSLQNKYVIMKRRSETLLIKPEKDLNLELDSYFVIFKSGISTCALDEVKRTFEFLNIHDITYHDIAITFTLREPDTGMFYWFTKQEDATDFALRF